MRRGTWLRQVEACAEPVGSQGTPLAVDVPPESHADSDTSLLDFLTASGIRGVRCMRVCVCVCVCVRVGPTTPTTVMVSVRCTVVTRVSATEVRKSYDTWEELFGEFNDASPS